MKLQDAPAQHHPATPARVVLAQQAALHDRLAHPSAALAGYIHGFGMDGAKKVHRNVPDQRSRDSIIGTMWYPHRVDTSRAAAANWCRDIGKSLFQARSFQVSAGMVDVVTALYENSSGLFHMEEPELPAPHGFCWLDKPLFTTDRWGKTVVERAFSWGLTVMNVTHPGIRRTDGLGRPLPEPYESCPAVRLTTWNYVADFALDDDMREHQDVAAQIAEIGGELSLSHTLVVLFGERHQYDFGKIEHPEELSGDYKPDSTLAWIHALWMVMEQEISVTGKARIDRPALRAARRSIKHGEVSVVLLRRSKSHAVPSQDGTHRDTDWSCRWLVQGHHRHLDSYTGSHHHALPGPYIDGSAYCVICWERNEAVRVTWIKSHVKGPEDRPLKSTGKLYRLAR